MSEEICESRQAFRDLAALLLELDEHYLSPEWGVTDPDDIAEGHRLIAHLLQSSLEQFLEGDPERPVFKRTLSPIRKYQGDNPDAIYHCTAIRGDREYVIRGNLAGVTYVSFTVYRGKPDGGWVEGVCSDINSQQIQSTQDGSYEIILSPTPQSGNWLKLEDDATQITCRHYFENAQSAAADPHLHIDLHIEPFGQVPAPARPTARSVASGLRAAANSIRHLTIARPKPNPANMPSWFATVPNTIGKPAIWKTETDGGGKGAPDIAYAAGRFQLSEDEVLIVEGVLPECLFANVMLWNLYLQTLEYRYRQVSLNRKQMTLGPDGRYRLVVAHRDPGIPNWLDTEGRSSGIIYWRFLLPQGEIMQPKSRVVRFTELGGMGSQEA